MMTYKMHLIRTGTTSPEQGKRYIGQSDPPLCGEGEEALIEMSRNFTYPPAEIVFTSPLSRCVKTAEILYPDTFVVESDGLMDMNLGEFEGKSFEELRGDKSFSLWINNSLENAPPGGEEVAAFTARIINAVRDIFIKMMDERITNAAVITHGGVIMTLLAAIGLPKMPLHQWAVENGTGYTLLFTPQMWMRDGGAEIFCRQPQIAARDDTDDYDLY